MTRDEDKELVREYRKNLKAAVQNITKAVHQVGEALANAMRNKTVISKRLAGRRTNTAKVGDIWTQPPDSRPTHPPREATRPSTASHLDVTADNRKELPNQ